MRVFLLSKQTFKIVQIHKQTTLLQLYQSLKQIISNDTHLKQLYSNLSPSAYSLYPNIQNNHQEITSNQPLYQCDCQGFILKQRQREQDQQKQIEQFQKISKIKGHKLIKIEHKNNFFKCPIFIQQQKSKVRNIFELLQKKFNQYNSNDYILQNKKGQQKRLSLQIKNLKQKVLYLKFKGTVNYEKIEQRKEVESLQKPIMNYKQAAMYEQFQVTKINDLGKRQKRTFGIDGAKIYNIRHKNQSISSSIMQKFMGTDTHYGTHNPQKLITDIIKIQTPYPNFIKIHIKQKKKVKVIHFEADSGDIERIKQKVTFLLQNR